MSHNRSPSPYDFGDVKEEPDLFSADTDTYMDFGSMGNDGMNMGGMGGPSKEGSGDSGMSMGMGMGDMDMGMGMDMGNDDGTGMGMFLDNPYSSHSNSNPHIHSQSHGAPGSGSSVGGSGMGGGMDVSRRDSAGDDFGNIPAMVALAAKDKLLQDQLSASSASASGMGGYANVSGYGGDTYLQQQQQQHAQGYEQGQYQAGNYGQTPDPWTRATSPGPGALEYTGVGPTPSNQGANGGYTRNTGAHELFGGAAPHNPAGPPSTGTSSTFGLTARTPFSAGHTPEPGVWGMQQTPEPQMDWGDGSGPGMDPLEFEELVERLSNQGSRAPTPNPDVPTPVNFPTSLTDGSLHSSHTESPFPTHIPSPSFSPLPRPGSALSNHSGVNLNMTSNNGGNSTSPFQKPQSPPSLIMPSNNAPSPSPALPPIITQPAPPPSGTASQGHALTGQIGGMGGLLPPINPALEHLSGMMGISPIAPNADGPQIFVQPSTPISGLKDGRGHFDAVLRKMGLQNQQQAGQGQGQGQRQGQGQGQGGGSEHGRSRSPSVSRSVSGESTGQGHDNVPPPMTGSAHAAQAQAHAQACMQLQNDTDWDRLRTGGGGSANNTARPRAKSDSHMPLAEADRQAMFSYLAQAQLFGVAPDQAVMDSMAPDQRSQIDAWLSSMSMNSPNMGYSQLQQQQQQAAAGGAGDRPTTMDPSQLPGNENAPHPSPGLASASATIATSAPPTAQPGYSSAADELRAKHLQQQRQLELIQAQQRHKLSLNTSVASPPNVSQSGILKYEPGEFSPTSLAFYQQQGLFPMVGTNAAPLPGGMGLFAAGTGALDGTYPNTAGLNPAHISTTASAPYYQTHFTSSHGFPSAALGSMGGAFPHTAAPGGTFLSPANASVGVGTGGSAGSAPRRRSFAEGSHPAAGAGTPGYGTALQRPSPMYAPGTGAAGTLSPFGTLDPGRLRGVGAQSAQGHRRAARSEDFGRSGWGVGQGGSTTDFLHSITGNDGSLIPPLRGRTSSHSRHSSASSVRSASPALSISSQGSSMSAYRGRNRMDMPEGQSVPMPMGHHSHSHSHSRSGSNASQQGRLAKMKVTSMATEVAATSRRTNDGVFHCPVPGCGSTFTRHFNLKGHMRSHNDERPFKCLYDGCPKAEVGFARQHDCKRHMLLHKGLRPFECDACGKKFARLDALTRHHKSEQGQECAITHPLPTNPDGSAMSESQYKAYKAHEAQLQGLLHPDMPMGDEDDGAGAGSGTGKRGKGRRKSAVGRLSASHSASGMSEGEDLGGGSGMEDYDRI